MLSSCSTSCVRKTSHTPPPLTDQKQRELVKVGPSPSSWPSSNSRHPTHIFPPPPGSHSPPGLWVELSVLQSWTPLSTARSPPRTLLLFPALPPKPDFQPPPFLLFLQLSLPEQDLQPFQGYHQRFWQQRRTLVKRLMLQRIDWRGRVSFHLSCWRSSRLSF